MRHWNSRSANREYWLKVWSFLSFGVNLASPAYCDWASLSLLLMYESEIEKNGCSNFGQTSGAKTSVCTLQLALPVAGVFL